MSIFSTPVPQLSFTDLDELLQQGAIENVRLEFKSLVPSKDETLKKLSSFANTFGGYLVVGAKASSTDGRITELTGVPPQNGYKQQVTQWCFDGVSPPLIVQVSDPLPVPGNSGNVCYVISASESEVAPHFLNGRKGVWIRFDEFSQRFEPQLATENELRHLFDRRSDIERRRIGLLNRSLRRFQEWRVGEANRNTTNKFKEPRIEISIGPRFPARPATDQIQLLKIFNDYRIPWRGVMFPPLNATLVTQHESALFLMPISKSTSSELIEANVWGMLFYGMVMDVEAPRESGTTGPQSGIHLYRFMGHLLAFVRHAAGIASRLSLQGVVRIEVFLSGVLGVPWLFAFHNEEGDAPKSEVDDSFSFSMDWDFENLRSAPDTLVMQMLQKIFFGMNWPAPANNPESLKELMHDGYEYNSWNKKELNIQTTT